ncbi:hypothetical protein AAFF_G00026660 [Aldrovandia affinis]|uniref:FYVE and coiled-coil domain-containing protein 1-like n=1 Tax=Aldrovandia affinis TaxID=143900 RepID=A0AAD7S508_9TELE|nr:hypothetical protein AAFF_G00026660 [Aldrovandia affinis]
MADTLRTELDHSELRQQELQTQLNQSELRQRELLMELDQSELRQQKLLETVHRQEEEAAELRGAVQDLQRQLEGVGVERTGLDRTAGENQDLLSRLDGSLGRELGSSGHLDDPAGTFHSLLDQLSDMESERVEGGAMMERLGVERLGAELKQAEVTLRESEGKLVAAADQLQAALAGREEEASALQRQQEELHGSLEEQELCAHEEMEELQRTQGGLREELESRVHKLESRAREEEEELSATAVEGEGSEEPGLMRLNSDLLQTASGKNKEAGLKREVADENFKLQAATVRILQLEAKLQGRPELAEKEAESHFSLVDGQLELSTQEVNWLQEEVNRLQEEVVELRTCLQATMEADGKARAQLEVAGAERDELRGLAGQLQAQLEELNRDHVEQLQRCRLEKEAQREEQERQASEEVTALKERQRKLAIEVVEAQEGLHRANIDKVELGVAVCALTSEREEVREELTVAEVRLRELEEEWAWEVEVLRAELRRAEEKVPDAVRDLQDQLEKAEGNTREEVTALKFQMSSETLSHRNQVQSLSDELATMRAEWGAELERALLLEAKVSELEASESQRSVLEEEKSLHITQCEKELQTLRDHLTRVQEELAECRCSVVFLRESLDRATVEKQSSDLETSAEIDDLYRTKKNLEERLIQLIKEKDALWQKSDALEFEQKLRAEEVMEREVGHCVSCHSQFGWWLRRHQCGLCGRAFCYYCSNNAVTTQQGSRRERCCRECYTQHSTVAERHPQAETPDTPTSPTYRSAHATSGTDDGVFDVITEDEVNGVYESDLPGGERAMGQQGTLELSSSTSTMDATPDDSEDLTTNVQDAEIYLLKSGELTLTVPLTIKDIAQFGDGSRELFIKSSCYSVIPMAMSEAGPTISWVFSSEPKSIYFSVVYQKTADAPLEESKVLIPLTRCNSHKETIQGQLKVRNPGTYMLMFDNSFSRFISKKVLYRLSIEKPVIYDGSDFP